MSGATANDFKNQINVTFPADEEASSALNEMNAQLPLINDNINEADEVFVIYLDGLEEDYEDAVVKSPRRSSFCIIKDDDEITIGFGTDMVIFHEGDGKVSVNLTKFPCGQSSEQDFEVTIFASQTGSGTLELEAELNITSISTTQFPPSAQYHQFWFTIRDDDMVEYTETLTLTASILSGTGIVDCETTSGCNGVISIQIKDNDGIKVGFTESFLVVSESASTIDLCVSIGNASIDEEIFISLIAEVKPGSADDKDFEFLMEPLSFYLDASQREYCFPLSLIDDNQLESQENFTVVLRKELLDINEELSLPLLSIDPAVAVVTIVDNDYTVGFEQAVYTANEADGFVEICAILQGSYPGSPVQVSLSTVQGNVSREATVDEDFYSISTSFNFQIGSVMRKCISVSLIDDAITEEDEKIFVAMQAVTAGTELGISNTIVIIVDDDVTIGFDQEQYSVNEGDGSIDVCVAVKSGALQQTAVLSICTEISTAIDFYDYRPMQSQLTFIKGGNVKACTRIEIIDDNFLEPEQQFVVRLEFISSISGFHLNSTTAIVLIHDNDGISELEGVCDADYSDLVEEQARVQTRVVESIVTDFAPELVSNIFNSSNTSTGSETVIRAVYNSLSEKLKINQTETKFNNFIEAVTEIAAAEEEACSRSDGLSTRDIPRIVADFNLAFSAGRNGDITNIRALYGQMLCIKNLETSKRRKRQLDVCDALVDTCNCPDGGLEGGEIICPCQFFRCLDPERHLEPILGFIEWDIQCLAFVIDTTGSMGGIIHDAQGIIKEFVRAEEDLGVAGCYLLVPFNDVGPDEDHVPDASVGPITIAYTDAVTDLLNFYRAVDSLYAHGGGDGPEYALDAMLRGLQYEDEDDYGTKFPVMIQGSQMVVLTDAPTKHQAIENTVADLANEIGVCIHFFVSGTYGTSDGLYQRISDRTSGTLIGLYSRWSLATFTSSYRDSPCIYTDLKRRKRATVSSASHCHSFHVSELAILFRFSGESHSSVTLTRPSGSTISVLSTFAAAIHSERHPEHGEWLACPSSGSLEFSVDQDFSLDVTVRYLKNLESGTLIASIYPPTECSTGQVMLTSRSSSLLRQPRLSLVNSERIVIQEGPLIKCSDALITNMSFPKGEYTYLLTGMDAAGIPISYHINNKVQFATGEYNLTVNDGPIEIEPTDTFNYSFSLSNLNSFDSVFDFSVEMPGFIGLVQPRNVLLQSGGTINVVITSWVSSSAIRRGSSYMSTITASNNCATLTGTKKVTIKSAGTPPPPDVCGCLNGGTCVVQMRRGREFKRCLCPTGYRGRTCEIST